MVEELLQNEEQRRLQSEFASEIEAYYRGQTAKERADEAGWARLGVRSLRAMYRDEK
ncbi:MAG: hypothetical protein ACOZIN_06555 [Myxococcota bacterium]